MPMLTQMEARARAARRRGWSTAATWPTTRSTTRPPRRHLLAPVPRQPRVRRAGAGATDGFAGGRGVAHPHADGRGETAVSPSRGDRRAHQRGCAHPSDVGAAARPRPGEGPNLRALGRPRAQRRAGDGDRAAFDDVAAGHLIRRSREGRGRRATVQGGRAARTENHRETRESALTPSASTIAITSPSGAIGSQALKARHYRPAQVLTAICRARVPYAASEAEPHPASDPRAGASSAARVSRSRLSVTVAVSKGTTEMSIPIEAPPQTARGDDGVRLRLARGSIVLPRLPTPPRTERVAGAPAPAGETS